MPEKISDMERIEELKRNALTIIPDGTVASPRTRNILYLLGVILSLILITSGLMIFVYAVYLLIRGKLGLGEFVLALEAIGISFVGLEIFPQESKGAVMVGRGWLAIPVSDAITGKNGLAKEYELYEKGDFTLKYLGKGKWKVFSGKESRTLNDESAEAVFVHVIGDLAAYHGMKNKKL